MVDDLLRQLVQGVLWGQPHVGVLRPLIRAVDTGEMGELTGSRLGVQPLGVAPLTILQRGVHEDLVKVESLVGMHFTGQVAMFFERADRRHQHGQARVGHQGCHMRQPTQVLGAVPHRETKIGVETVPQVVTVENIGRATSFEELLLDQHRNRRLPRTRQAGEPQRAALGQPFPGRHQ